jgi:uncharacterized protein
MTIFSDFDPDNTINSAAAVPSPCVSTCQMHVENGLCVGCYRTIEEIVVWGKASEQLKRAIWQQIRQRQFPEQN